MAKVRNLIKFQKIKRSVFLRNETNKTNTTNRGKYEKRGALPSTSPPIHHIMLNIIALQCYQFS